MIALTPHPGYHMLILNTDKQVVHDGFSIKGFSQENRSRFTKNKQQSVGTECLNNTDITAGQRLRPQKQTK